MNRKTGVLLINLGTPSAPDTLSVKQYLTEFLMDPKVIDLPNPWRSILVRGLIIPFRAKKSAHAYQQIWTDKGSPLLVNSLALKQELQMLLGDQYIVDLAMNYGKPSISAAIYALQECDKIIVMPLFPQYSTAVTESILEKVELQHSCAPLILIKDFFNHPAFIKAYTTHLQAHLDGMQAEYLLLSYHGLPMRQLYKTSGAICKSCISAPCPKVSDRNRNCYRAQCYDTSRLLTEQLSLNNTKVLTCFQSRLGRLTWTQPYTEKVLQDLAAQGIKRVAIACPSFVTDCLETLEEIGLRARESFIKAGGSELRLIPGLNQEAGWIRDLIGSRVVSAG